MITGAVYPEVLAELLIVDEESDVDARALDISVEALELLNHPDAYVERHPNLLEDCFVSYRQGPIGTQTVSVPIPTRLLLDARDALDRLRDDAFNALVTLLQNEKK
jgi:hypothetical protein